jgi:hypothetical protein
MTSSGTYTFAPSLGELVLYAFNLCQIRSPALTQAHMETARMAANLLLSDWSQQGVNLWKVELVIEPLIEGQETYAVDPRTIAVLDAYVRNDADGPGAGPPVDTIILPISRSEYAGYPRKDSIGSPTVFWFDRLISPTITLWPVPDASRYTELHYYRVCQIQDAKLENAATMDLPYRWFNAFADGLALQLARSWAPALISALAPFAAKSYTVAAGNDVETANFYVTPLLGSYFRY